MTSCKHKNDNIFELGKPENSHNPNRKWNRTLTLSTTWYLFSGYELTNNHSYNLHMASSVHFDSGHGQLQRFQALNEVRRPLLFNRSRTHKTQTGNDIGLILWLCHNTLFTSHVSNGIKLIPTPLAPGQFFTLRQQTWPDSGDFKRFSEVCRPHRFHSSKTKPEIGNYIEPSLCQHTWYTFPRSE